MIRLNNVSKIYNLGKVKVNAIKNISMHIEEGEFVAIMGPSGSGKSTLMNLIGCLDTPTTGEYFLDGKKVGQLKDDQLAQIRNEKIGFVFQTFNLLPRLSARANVELPLIYAGKRKNRKRRAIEALKMVNLGSRVNHHPSELSGGERQRVAIARALINQPAIILADEPTGNLDSKSSQEIMSILSQLHKKGITIVLVTHEEPLAEYANRVIRLKDGEVVEDTRKKLPRKTNPGGNSSNEKRSKRKGFSIGEIKESFLMALYSISSNKLRSFLTMLGIIVGVAAVITMVALGQGAQKQITDHIGQMGVNLLMVFPGGERGRHRMGSRIDYQRLTYNDALALKQRSENIARVAPNLTSNGTVVFQDKSIDTRIDGVTQDFLAIKNFQVKWGEFITEEDDRFKKRVAVLGYNVAQELFGEKYPVGEYIKINRVIFQVKGVLEEKGASSWRSEDDMVLVPLQTAQKRLFGVDYVTMINVEAKSREVMEKAEEDITRILRHRHNLPENKPDDFRVFSQKEILTAVKETTRTFTLLLAGIAVVSLVVGGIGIMNIMLVSVTERTREIGIRKAIGGRRVDILGQFLIEAIMISLTGGVIGILGGSGISRLISHFSGLPLIITPQSVILSFSFAFAVGLFFGFYPARKAAMLNPIQALRYE